MSNTEHETFTERRTLREHLDALRARLAGGEDVSADELADATTRADAEREVENARRTRWQRKRAEAEQAAAREQMDGIVAGLTPDAHKASRDRIDAALSAFWTVVAAEVDAAREHNEQLRRAASTFGRTGYRMVPTMHASSRLPEGVDPDHHARASGSGVSLTWAGERYVTHDPRAYALDLWRPTRDEWRRDLDRAVTEQRAA